MKSGAVGGGDSVSIPCSAACFPPNAFSLSRFATFRQTLSATAVSLSNSGFSARRNSSNTSSSISSRRSNLHLMEWNLIGPLFTQLNPCWYTDRLPTLATVRRPPDCTATRAPNASRTSGLTYTSSRSPTSTVSRSFLPCKRSRIHWINAFAWPCVSAKYQTELGSAWK
ncbi:hypothetical protein FQZ97_858500 [compost metagenome]